LVLIIWIKWQDERRGRVPHLQKGANEQKHEKGGTHKEMISRIDWEESEDEGNGELLRYEKI
jgi:hypothetical protein